jgi:hypothetical protein
MVRTKCSCPAEYAHTSLAAPVLTLGASLTLPEGPLGSAKMPFSAPAVIARFN